MNEKELIEFYKLEFIKNENIKKLDKLRKETFEVLQQRNRLQKINADKSISAKADLQEAIRNKEFKKIVSISQKNADLERNLKNLKKMVRISDKINKLNSNNISINEKIDRNIEKMVMREARARNIITKKIAKVRNAMTNLNTNFLRVKDKYQQFKLRKRVDKFNFKINTLKDVDINVRKMNIQIEPTGKDINKVNIQNRLNNFTISKNNELTKYIDTRSNVEIKEIDNKLSCDDRIGSDKDRAKALLDVVKSKNWDIKNLQINGSDEFKKEFQKQVQKQQEQEKQQNNNAFTKLREMKAKENNEIKLKEMKVEKVRSR